MSGRELDSFECRVPEQTDGERLDRWLSRLADAPSRAQIKRAADSGRLRVNGESARASYRLRGGETVNVATAASVSAEAVAQPIAIDVLFEDEEFLAINKAAGMVVHPAAGNHDGTLVNALLHRYPSSALPGNPERPGIVHRLDKDTSGVILVARTARAHEALSRQFRERGVEKRYLAVVWGMVGAAGEIDLPIGRHRTQRKRMTTRALRTRVALTRYEPLEPFERATRLLARPATGRTHQIRVHLSAKGWPVVGDTVYGAGRNTLAAVRGLHRRAREAERVLRRMPRQALHAASIEFDHPDGRRIRVEAPLPPDFEMLLRDLRGL